MPQTSELLWSIVLITIIGVGALLMALVVRTFRNRMRDRAPTEAFTIQDLREMREAGQITDQEFEAMRAAIIERTTAERPPANSAREPPGEHDARDGEPDRLNDDQR